jgi:hypothetical protein
MHGFAVGFNDVLTDRQSQASAAFIAAAGLIRAVKTFEDA